MRKAIHRGGWLAGGLLLTLFASPGIVHAQDSHDGSDRFERAAREFEVGLELADDQRWEEALPHFLRSYELHPNYFNGSSLALAYFELRRFREAHASSRRFLEEFSEAEVRARLQQQFRQRAQINAQLEQFRDRYRQATENVAFLDARLRTIQLVDIPDRTRLNLTINGDAVEVTEERPFTVDVYEEDVSLILTSAGSPIYSWTGAIQRGETIQVRVTESRAQGSGMRPLWWWVIIGAVVAVGATTAAILVNQDSNQLEPDTGRVIPVVP